MSESPRTVADVLADYAALLRRRPELGVLVVLHLQDGTLLAHAGEFGIALATGEQPKQEKQDA